MTRKAILQIGTEKTGTTTLQHFLATNRDRLVEAGFLYPRFCGGQNHTGLAAYALAPSRRDPIQIPFGVTSEAGVAPMRQRMHQAATEELATPGTVIFCSEHCHSRLRSLDEVATLRDLLGEFFDDVQICVYLRRQDQLAVSLYSTRLKSGGTEPGILPKVHPDDTYFNYDRLLEMWETCFGASNVHARRFDRATLTGGSIVSDFVAMWGLGELDRFIPVKDKNESIQPLAQEFLRLTNRHLETFGGVPVEEIRSPLVSRLAKLYPGRGALPGRANAMEFYDRFRASNEAVRERHFPDLETLFPEDFDSYPEVADDRDFATEDMARIAAQLHTSATRETRRLEAELAVRSAQLHWERDERDAAETTLRRAIRRSPESADLNRTLAEFLDSLDRPKEAAAFARRAAALRPGNCDAWHWLGTLMARSGNLAGAIRAQQRALELSPLHPTAAQELARLRAQADDAAVRIAADG